MAGDLGCLLASPAGMCARRRSHFLLLGQKKVTKEKATPTVCVPALLRWETCGARFVRGLAKLATLKQRQPLSAQSCAPRRIQRGTPGAGSVAPCATSRLGREPGIAGLGVRSCIRSLGSPSQSACDACFWRDQERDCLSVASSSAPPSKVRSAGCPQRSEGSRRVGAAFSLVAFFWLRKRKPLRRREHIPACLSTPVADQARPI